jgi:threonine dehydratase
VPNENFARGVALFNDGHFFEAHEVLEDVWRAAPVNDKRFLQGIVQLAVAFHHHSTGNRVGMRSVMERGMRNIRGNDHVYEVNVDALVTSMAAWREALDNGGPLPELPRIRISSSVNEILPVTLTQVEQARRNIQGIALRTPLVRCNAEAPCELHLKLENLQPIGSFKIRGAANVMALTPKEELARGVLAASAGNMAQGVAFCARRMGIPATIVAPDTAPATKIQAVERMGGRVIKAPFADWWRTFEMRSYPGVDATFIHAFDDPHVMAGNGTIALELLEDLPDLDTVVVPWGGGGLTCGIASVLRAKVPHVKIYAAEIETGAPLAASLTAGEPRTVDYKPSFVDGIGSKMVFTSMFERARNLVEGSLVVSLSEAARAMKLVAERNRIIAEGAAACAVAAALSGRAGHGKVVAIVSGGNIDLEKFAQMVSEAN